MNMRSMAALVVLGSLLASATPAVAQCPSGSQLITIDAVTGTVAGPNGKRVESKPTCLMIKNKNPYVYVYQVTTDETAVTFEVGSVISALAHVAGLPAGVLPLGASALSGPAPRSASGDDDWQVPSTCIASAKQGAEQYLGAVKNQYQTTYRATAEWYAGLVEASQALAKIDGETHVARDEIRKDLQEDRLRLATDTLAERPVGQSVGALQTSVASLDRDLDSVASRIRTTRSVAEEFQRLYPTCIAPGVKAALEIEMIDVTRRRGELGKISEQLSLIAADIKAAAVVKANPITSYNSYQVYFPKTDDGKLSVTVSRKKATETTLTPLAARQFEIGDVKRFRVSVGFAYGGTKDERVSYQPIIVARPDTITSIKETNSISVDNKPSSSRETTIAAGGTSLVIGEESRRKDFVTPVALVHFRPWGRGAYLSFGGGPSGAKGTYAVSWMGGMSVFMADVMALNFLAVYPVVSYTLPQGATIGSELPAATTEVPTVKRYRPGIAIALSFKIR